MVTCWLAACLRGGGQAVQTWHEAGVLHLDIKPSNVAVDAAGEVVVLDAGHSRILETGSTTCRVSCGHGTRGFIPPELEDTGSGIAGPWCDVFSLGKTLDWMVCRVYVRGLATLGIHHFCCHAAQTPQVHRPYWQSTRPGSMHDFTQP